MDVDIFLPSIGGMTPYTSSLLAYTTQTTTAGVSRQMRAAWLRRCCLRHCNCICRPHCSSYDKHLRLVLSATS